MSNPTDALGSGRRPSKPKDFADHISEEWQQHFRERCDVQEKFIETLCTLLTTKDEHKVPCVSPEDGRISIVVHGKPATEDWRRVQAFAALVMGEFDVDDRKEDRDAR